MTVPTARPSELIAGDTWRWTRDLSDYPASTWTLTYHFENAKGKFNFAATADGDTQSVSVAAATTAAYTPGRYKVYARATDGTIVETVTDETGWLDVLPNIGSITDHRSWNELILDALRDAYEGRASTDQLAMTIGNRSISSLTKADMRKEIEAFERRVRRDEDIAAINAGRPTHNRILVRG